MASTKSRASNRRKKFFSTVAGVKFVGLFHEKCDMKWYESTWMPHGFLV